MLIRVNTFLIFQFSHYRPRAMSFHEQNVHERVEYEWGKNKKILISKNMWIFSQKIFASFEEATEGETKRKFSQEHSSLCVWRKQREQLNLQQLLHPHLIQRNIVDVYYYETS